MRFEDTQPAFCLYMLQQLVLSATEPIELSSISSNLNKYTFLPQTLVLRSGSKVELFSGSNMLALSNGQDGIASTAS